MTWLSWLAGFWPSMEGMRANLACERVGALALQHTMAQQKVIKIWQLMNVCAMHLNIECLGRCSIHPTYTLTLFEKCLFSSMYYAAPQAGEIAAHKSGRLTRAGAIMEF